MLRLMLPEKEFNPIVVTKDGRVNMTEFKLVALTKALLPISSTSVPISTELISVTVHPVG